MTALTLISPIASILASSLPVNEQLTMLHPLICLAWQRSPYSGRDEPGLVVKLTIRSRYSRQLSPAASNLFLSIILDTFWGPGLSFGRYGLWFQARTAQPQLASLVHENLHDAAIVAQTLQPNIPECSPFNVRSRWMCLRFVNTAVYLSDTEKCLVSAVP